MGGGIASPELAAAVSNAGGLGTLGLTGLPASFIGEQIRRMRALTSKPFLANLIIARLEGDELAACFDAGLPILGLYVGRLWRNHPRGDAQRAAWRTGLLWNSADLLLFFASPRLAEPTSYTRSHEMSQAWTKT
jgi:NAD(P)H-dependent flavin oxidoreductase YrpB (nitropropane dioxygenase family)